MILIKSSYLNFFSLTALLWASLAGGLVFFFPLNEYGEFAIPRTILLVGDLTLATLSIPAILLIFRTRAYLSLNSLAIIAFIVVSTVASFKMLLTMDMYDYFHYFVRNFLLYFIFGYIIFISASINSVHQNNKLILILYYCIAFPAILICFFYFFGCNDVFWERSRLTGTLINHNSFAFVCVFFLYWAFNQKKYFRVALVGLLILFSGSLTGIVGFVLLFFLRPMQSFILVFIATLFCLVYEAFFSSLHFVSKFQQIIMSDSGHMTSKSARVDQFNWVINDFIINPLNLLIGYLDSTQFERFDSQYYNILVNFGFFAMVSFLFIIYRMFLAVRSKEVLLFLIWCFFAFAITAFLSRWNILLIFFFIMGYGVSNNQCIIFRALK